MTRMPLTKLADALHHQARRFREWFRLTPNSENALLY